MVWPAVSLVGAGAVRASARPDTTLRLGAPDLLPADDFEARLAEIDGARFDGGVVRGGRVVAAPRRRAAGKPRSPPPPLPPPPRRERAPARNKLPSYPALKLEIPPMYYDDANDDDLVSSFRTGPFARLRTLLSRLF